LFNSNTLREEHADVTVSDSSSGERDSAASSPIDSEADSTGSSALSSSSASDSESELEAEEAEPTNLDPMSVYGPPAPVSDFTYKLKIFLGFLQIVTNVSSGLEIQWPNTFKNFVLLFNVVNMDFLFSNVTSAECLFSADYYYDRFLLIVIAPVGLLVATALFLLLPRYFEVACFRHTTVQERARQTMSFWF
jgi:hypothetical protein